MLKYAVCTGKNNSLPPLLLCIS